MSKYEKTNMVVAIVGLCVAVLGVVLGAIAPFITYRWLDPQLQSFAHRPKFQISTLKQQGARKVAEFEFKKNEDFEIAFQRWAADVDNAFYSVVVTNVGELPAKDALITTQYRNLTESSPVSVTFNPTVLTETSTNGNTQFITIKQPIAPHDKIEITFSRIPRTISAATSEFGEPAFLLPQPDSPIVIWKK